MNILVTGGLGYIGSHTVVQLIEAGSKVYVLDNLCNSKFEVVDRIDRITGTKPEFIQGDIRDRQLLRQFFAKTKIDTVIHFAGLKSVSDGQTDPLTYYDNNLTGSIVLLEEMDFANVHSIVFSSSATVYGEPKYLPYDEMHSLTPINVYGKTKLMVENVLQDLSASNNQWRIAILRYFNPVGAHVSGLIGEDPSGVPNNLMPFLSQVAVKKRPYLSVYGDDYDTEDGTGKRDYIHVDDLASGHMAALKYLQSNSGVLITNLGTGKSTSVLELIRAFEAASKQHIPHQITSRRSGDLPEYYADSSHANDVLKWVAKYDVDRMCQDTWRWQSLNPEGFK